MISPRLKKETRLLHEELKEEVKVLIYKLKKAGLKSDIIVTPKMEEDIAWESGESSPFTKTGASTTGS